MALIKCYECGKEISDKSKSCLHCGAMIQNKNEFELKSAEMKAENSAKKQKLHIKSLIIGLLLTALVLFFVYFVVSAYNSVIVTIGYKVYTVDDVEEITKGQNSLELLLDEIDSVLLNRIYPEDSEMLKAIDEDAKYYLEMYQEYYDYTKEEFLRNNGFEDYSEFTDYLKLDYRRQMYLNDYIKGTLTEEEIKQYYIDNVFGDINAQHILVEVTSNDDVAKKLAKEIINKLENGTSWKTIQKDYKNEIIIEDLGYVSWKDSLEENFITALKNMESYSYSKEPIKTSYGYHIIYRINQKPKPSLDVVRDAIIEQMVSDKLENDPNLLYKILISLREEKNVRFKSKKMKEKYDEYCRRYK